MIFKYCINCFQSERAQQENVIRCIHMKQSVEIMDNGKTGLPDLIHLYPFARYNEQLKQYYFNTSTIHLCSNWYVFDTHRLY